MAEPVDPERDEDSLPTQLPTSGLSGMESLETFVGRPVDPGVELEDDDLTDAETVIEGAPSPAVAASGAAQTSRHEVRSRIARGGMGAIYKVRDKDLRRELAMKVVLGRRSSGSGAGTGPTYSPEVLQRFLEEAQITAQLVHPGVVPVHELGVDPQGRVYFTMSLVRGETLAVVIRKARAEQDGWTRARALQVLLRVCETMAFAHDRGVIHRDLKPDNVMVGKFGQTYVMDWGLAKVIGRDDARDSRPTKAAATELPQIESLRSSSTRRDSVRRSAPSNEIASAESAAGAEAQAERAPDTIAHDSSVDSAIGPSGDDSQGRAVTGQGSPVMTLAGAVLGTPAYMPPEQAKGEIERVDRRSDVYAIGTLLYQLLTGEPPYVRSGSRMAPEMVLAAVTLGPPRPIHEIDPSAPDELQAICEKAMARSRAERYASAEEMSEDLQRFLAGRVVLAHRTGALIEMKKWVARNRTAAATAAAALVVVAGLTAFFLQSVADERDRAVSAEAVATDKAAEAQKERERAEELASFMLVELRDRLAPIGRLELLDEVATKSLAYYENLPSEGLTDDQRRGRGVALGNIGDVLRAQGDLTGALTSYTRSFEIAEQLAAADRSSAELQHGLLAARDRIGEVLRTQGDLAAGLAHHRAGLEIAEQLVARDAANVAWQEALSLTHTRVGRVLFEQGDLAGALESFQAALDISTRLAAADPSDMDRQQGLAVSHDRVGSVHRAMVAYPDALRSYRACLEISERVAAHDPADTGRQRDLLLAYNNFAEALWALGDLDSALGSYRSSIGIAERLAAQDPTNAEWQGNLSLCHNQAGEVLCAQGDFATALESYRSAAEISGRLVELAPTNARWKRNLAISTNNVGRMLLRVGSYAEAADVLRAAESQHAAAVQLNVLLAAQHWSWETKRLGAEFLAEERTPASPADQCALAHACSEARLFERSLQAFERALTDASIREDLVRGHVYAAACTSALAAATGGARASVHRKRALQWLGEDVAARRALLADVEARLAGGAGDRSRLEAERTDLRGQIEWARSGDPDLESIRGAPEFERLFAGPPNAD